MLIAQKGGCPQINIQQMGGHIFYTPQPGHRGSVPIRGAQGPQKADQVVIQRTKKMSGENGC